MEDQKSVENIQPNSELVGPGEFVSQDTLVAILKHGFNSDPDGKSCGRTKRTRHSLLCNNEVLSKFYITLDFNKILACQI